MGDEGCGCGQGRWLRPLGAAGDRPRGALLLPADLGPRTLRTTGLPSLISWASIMATLWSMVVEWSVLSAELPTNVPRAKTAAQRTCKMGRVAVRPEWVAGVRPLRGTTCPDRAAGAGEAATQQTGHRVSHQGVRDPGARLCGMVSGPLQVTLPLHVVPGLAGWHPGLSWPGHTGGGGLTSGMGSERRLHSFSCALSLTPHHLAESKFCQMRPRQMATHWRSSGWGSLSCSRQMAIKFPWRQASCEKADNTGGHPPGPGQGRGTSRDHSPVARCSGIPHCNLCSVFLIPDPADFNLPCKRRATRRPPPPSTVPPSEGDCLTDIQTEQGSWARPLQRSTQEALGGGRPRHSPVQCCSCSQSRRG